MTAIPDNTPLIVGAGQYTDHLEDSAGPPFAAPMTLAARAAAAALEDAGCAASAIDSIAVIRLFADSNPVWRSPFGGSDNPPQSVARRLGIEVCDGIYSTAGGTQPLDIMAELLQSIAAGQRRCALLAGAEAIASERFAARRGLQDDWSEHYDEPMDERQYSKRFASREELQSGLFLPAHYYAMIENRQAWLAGRDVAANRRYMARLFAPFSEVAAANPYSFAPQAFSADELSQPGPGDYPVAHPYSRRLVASDAVNQAAALLLTSAGEARRMGIPQQRWIAVAGFARGTETPMMLRPEPARSGVMQRVFQACLQAADTALDDIELLDIYSCFPSAVTAACDALQMCDVPDRSLTVTGGLPYFGGPGNNYSLHALAEMAQRLRDGGRGLVTANGGILSDHAAALLRPAAQATARELREGYLTALDIAPEQLPACAVCAAPERGRILCHTVIDRRDQVGLGVIMGQTEDGGRFMARTEQPGDVQALLGDGVIGREIAVSPLEKGYAFRFA